MTFDHTTYNKLRRDRQARWTQDRMLWAVGLCMGPDRDNASCGPGSFLHAMEHTVVTGRMSTSRLQVLMGLRGAQMRKAIIYVGNLCQRSRNTSVNFTKEALYLFLDHAHKA